MTGEIAESAPNACPREDCDGYLETVMVGGSANPKSKSHCKSCKSSIEWCVECNSPLVPSQAESRWIQNGEIVGQDRQVYWCDSCEDDAWEGSDR